MKRERGKFSKWQTISKNCAQATFTAFTQAHYFLKIIVFRTVLVITQGNLLYDIYRFMRCTYNHYQTFLLTKLSYKLFFQHALSSCHA